MTLGSALWVAWYALAAGLPPAVVLGIATGGTVAIVAAAERLLPFRADWNQSRGDVATDALHSLVSSYAGRELYKVFFTVALLPITIRLSDAWGAPVWPSAWPIALQVALAAAVAELGQYACHRLGHERELFWKLHATHHSPERLYWLNAGRDHPLGVLLLYAGTGLPLIALGVPADTLTLFYVLEGVHGLFQHANIDVRLGPLNWVFSMAELHRWHHSRRVEEANRNYGATLILWDIVFGTRFFPGRHGPESIGIDGLPNFPRGFLGQLGVPFRWASLGPGSPPPPRA